jgi:hypothetical protein
VLSVVFVQLWQCTCQGCQVAAVMATFLKCGSFKNNYGCGKFVAVSGHKVAVNVHKVIKCGRRKLFLKIPNQTDRNMATSIKCAHFYKLFCVKFTLQAFKVTVS